MDGISTQSNSALCARLSEWLTVVDFEKQRVLFIDYLVIMG